MLQKKTYCVWIMRKCVYRQSRRGGVRFHVQLTSVLYLKKETFITTDSVSLVCWQPGPSGSEICQLRLLTLIPGIEWTHYTDWHSRNSLRVFDYLSELGHLMSNQFRMISLTWLFHAVIEVHVVNLWSFAFFHCGIGCIYLILGNP